MAPRGLGLGLAMAVLVTMLCRQAAAQSSCTPVIISLMPCLGYITGNSSVPAPTCCAQLAATVRLQPQCLCTVLNGGASMPGITINQTQALSLPGACNVQTPPVSQCNAVAAGPAGGALAPTTETPSAASAPTNHSPATPSSTVAPSSGTGSKATPAGQSSGGNSTTLSITLFVSLLFFASFAPAPAGIHV